MPYKRNLITKYFQNDQNINNELNEVALNYLCDTLEIDTNIADISLNCYVLAPFHDENHELEAYQMNYGFDFGLPANVDDLVSFVRNPNNRPLLYTQSNIMLSDEIDLSKFDFATFDTISKECGMLFSELNLYNSNLDLPFSEIDNVKVAEVGGYPKEVGTLASVCDITPCLEEYYKQEIKSIYC